MLIYPLVFGGAERRLLHSLLPPPRPGLQRSELLVALAQQATLAIQLTRLAYSAKEAAVLVERTRIGQEIHDGLAQAFTGILMQLGAAEEFPPCRRKNSELAGILSRIRDLARDGLAEARRSVLALRLDQTPRAGLGTALRQLAERSTVPGASAASSRAATSPTGLRRRSTSTRCCASPRRRSATPYATLGRAPCGSAMLDQPGALGIDSHR